MVRWKMDVIKNPLFWFNMAFVAATWTIVIWSAR